MTFPKIETFYGMYAKGKFHGLPRGLGYRAVYDDLSQTLALSLAKVRKNQTESSPLLQVFGSPSADVNRTRDAILRLAVPEIYWLVFGRTEFRLSHAFVSNALHMGPMFPVGVLLQKEKRRVARLTWPKDAICCGLVCAYLEIVDISVMDEKTRTATVELYGPHEVQISISECDGVNPVISPPHPRVIFTGNLDEPLVAILARRAFGDLLETYQGSIPEPVLAAAESLYENHDSEIQHSLSLVSVGALAFLLFDQNHRFIKKVNPLIAPRRRGDPSEPVPYLVGDGLSVLPKDRNLVNVGAVAWEQFEGGDGQVLFHWPSLIEGQVETPPESPNILENDGG